MCALNDEGRQNNNVINYVINYVINNVINSMNFLIQNVAILQYCITSTFILQKVRSYLFCTIIRLF